MGWISSPWENLNAYILDLGKDPTLRETWKMIGDNPLNERSIDALVLDGWEVNLVNSPSGGGYGTCDIEERTIEMIEGPTPYDRDKTLFHELVHAWYNRFGNPLSDVFYGRNPVIQDRCLKNRAIVEWLSRKKRARPSLLRYTISSFDLEPKVYDYASFHAFVQDFPEQMNDLKTAYENAGILMD